MHTIWSLTLTLYVRFHLLSTCITPQSTALERQQLLSYSRNSRHFTEPEGLLKSPLVPVLGQMNSVHILPSYFLTVNFNTIIPPMFQSSKWSHCFVFLYQNFVCISLLSHVHCMLHPTPSIFSF
jgi:hypothetical protein